jgi:Ca-activated chloride channel family protein
MIRLAYPLALLLLLVLPPLWYLWLRAERRPVIRFSSLADLRAAAGTLAGRARIALPILRTLAIIALIVAVARPQRGDQTSRVYVEGIAIQMVLDTSSSMGDVDLSPRNKRMTRFDVVKSVMRRFIEGDEKLRGRPNDLIGLVRFARYADSVCPLTLDHGSLLDVLDKTPMIVPPSQEDGTAIGDGLALAVERMRDLKRRTGSGEQLIIKSRIIILLTDGENNAGQITPEQAGDLAATYGIKVYTILAGTGERFDFARRPVNDAPLRHIAEVSGGRFFRATDSDALEKVYAAIDELERTKAEEQRYVDFQELAWPWLLTALACVSLATLLDATLLRKIP